VIVAVVALGTLAFGGVYPWGFIPMFGAAAAIGIAGLYQRGLRPDLRSLAFALFIVCAAGALQLVPVPTAVLTRLSPATPVILASRG
jgi:hypothetical protein